ncbi:MAG: spheroidene monooxygenase [Bacteroidetes bacterium]|nr:spheroidene monooxygenase [Bacteroidota bacterium]
MKEEDEKYCTIIIARYPKWLGIFGFFSMAFFRIPLFFNKRINFYKLMGSGRNGSFDIHPDWNQWSILFTTIDKSVKAPALMYSYFHFFNCDLKEFVLQPIEGHGLRDKKNVFGTVKGMINDTDTVAVLTRASIRFSRLKHFWSNVNSVAAISSVAKGLIVSYGIGESPWIKQATFSVWENKAAMVDFAYTLPQHRTVIKKTRNENWYKEEMFIRFKIIAVKGFNHIVEMKMLNLQPSNDKA